MKKINVNTSYWLIGFDVVFRVLQSMKSVEKFPKKYFKCIYLYTALSFSEPCMHKNITNQSTIFITKFLYIYDVINFSHKDADPNAELMESF